MVLHVTFSDGSNPWVSLPLGRHTIAKYWRKWVKYSSTAQHAALHNGYICTLSEDRAGYWVFKQGEYFDTKKYYKHLGHALAALERLGGGKA